MNMKDILQDISDKSGAEQSNLWYSIEAQMKEENLMRKSKNRRLHLSLSAMAALISIIVLGSFSFGRSIQRSYHPLTLAEIEAMATPLNLELRRANMTLQLEWGYADPAQIILAYTIYDGDGNAISPADVDDASVELRLLWDDSGQYASLGGHLSSANQEAARQIVQFSNPALHLQTIDTRLDGNYNLAQSTSLNLRLVVSGSHNDLAIVRHTLDFELPYGAALYEEHNDFADVRAQWENPDEAVHDVEMYYKDLIIADSAISAIVCMRLPDDALSGLYFPRDVNLYLDDSKVDAILVTNGASFELYDNHPAVEIDARYSYSGENNRAYCGEFTWHIVLDIMPDTIRIEIPSLYTSQIPHRFESQEQRLYYARLLVEQGYELTVIEGEEGFMTSQFPDAWHDLDPVAQAIIQNEVLDAFFTEFPPDEPYIASWEYTFNLTKPEILIPDTSYYPVTLADIEAMATSINLSETHHDRTLTVDWAYADANQVVLAYTIFDLDSNALTGAELDDGSVELHVFWDDSGQYSSHGRAPLVSNLNSTQQVARFSNMGNRFDLIKEHTDGEYDLNQLTNLDIRAVITTGRDAESSISYRPRFEVPFAPSDFKQNNRLD